MYQAAKNLTLKCMNAAMVPSPDCKKQCRRSSTKNVEVESDLLPSPGCDDNIVEEIVGSLDLVPVEKVPLVMKDVRYITDRGLIIFPHLYITEEKKDASYITWLNSKSSMLCCFTKGCLATLSIANSQHLKGGETT